MKRFMNQALDEMAIETIGPREWLPSEAKIGSKKVSVTRLALPRRVGKGGGQIVHPATPLTLVDELDPGLKSEVTAISPALSNMSGCTSRVCTREVQGE